MVRVGLVLLLVAPAALGQAPAPPAGPAAQPQPQAQQRVMDPELWKHLLGWEGVMRGASNFVSQKGTRTDAEDASPGRPKTFEVDIWCLKPNMARMRLDRLPAVDGQPRNPAAFELYICDGKAIYEYDGQAKTVTEHPLGPNGGVKDNLLLEFMSGSISARQAAARFAIEWAKPDDTNYLILNLTPLLPDDQKEFDRLTLVLVKPGLPSPYNRLAYLPRTARLVKDKGKKSETWDFPNPMLNAMKDEKTPIGPADFAFVKPAEGWKVVKAGPQRPAGPPPGGRQPAAGGR